ncbi:MAG: cohesin domain-containing protein [Bacteroidia bacterium]
MRNILKSFIISAGCLCLLMLPQLLRAQSAVVDFVPNPLNSVVNNGSTFAVAIEVETNGQATAGAEIHLDFDPTFLEVLSVTGGTSLPIPLIPMPNFDNGSGTIDFAAGTFGIPVSTDFTFVTITFEAKALVSSTAITYATSGFPRITSTSVAGINTLNQAIPFSVSIVDPCVINTSGLVVSACNDGGTPSDPSDDTFSFSINPTGTDIGTTYTVSGDVSGAGTYGIPNNFAGLQAGGGDLSVVITDDNSAGCSISFTVSDPGSCSASCTLTDAGLSNVSCNDNGTPNDPTDDFITFSLNPTGANIGASYSVSGDVSFANVSYGPFSFLTLPGTAGQGDLNITLTDVSDPSCQLSVNISDPGTCSNSCDITASGLSNIQCNDNGTAADASDDFISFDLNPTGFNLGASYSVAGATATGTYGQVSSFTTAAGTAGAGDVAITIIDANNGACTFAESVTDPGTCSNLCDITASGLSNIQCNDNGTPADVSDDFISFNLNPSGFNLAATYTVSGAIGTGTYGSTASFTTAAGTAGAGDLSIMIVDGNSGACTFAASVTDPGACSNACDITASGLSNIQCNDNGTAADASDDFISFDLNPTGFNLGANYSVAGATGTGTYGGTSSFTTVAGTAGAGDVAITIIDGNNGGCTFAESVTDPGTCSNLCDITASGLSNIQCNDNGTPSDPSDDFITFDLNPVGNALATTYSLTGVTGSGTYGQVSSFSTASGSAGAGDINISIVDANSGACTFAEIITDPGTCSDQCLISDLGLSNIQCNDNATDTDPADDYITFALNPTGNGLGTTYNMPAGFSPSTGTYGVLTSFSTTTATAGAGDISLTITDATDNACTGTITISDPGSCSNANNVLFSIGSDGGITCGSLLIPVTVTNYTDILGGQGSISWDPNVITLLSTSDYGISDIVPASFNTLPGGEITFSYDDATFTGKSLTDGDTLFIMEFDVSGPLGGTTSIQFSNTVSALLFDLALNSLTPLTNPGSISIPNSSSISGNAVSELGAVINGVSFKMSGTDNPPIQTGNPGYNFSFTRCGTNEIGAFKNNDVDLDNGVNTLDIILIQRQILNIAPLSTPYKKIAADVSNNGSIETLDIIFIRQMILQQRLAFPEPGGSNALGAGTRLWAFTPSDYVFSDPNSFAFDTSRVYNPMNPMSDQDFIGMKLGDVNNSWDPNVAKTGTVGDVAFEMQDVQSQANEVISIPVSVKDFQNIAGYQFTMSWDPSVLSFLEVENKNLQTNFGENSVQEGHLTASWNDPNAQAISLNDGTEVFELRFQVVGELNTQTALAINSFLTKSEAYNANLDMLNIVSSPATITLGSTTAVDPTENNGFGLYQNVPNPFGQSTDIIFELPESNLVTIEIYNNVGQIIRTYEGRYPQGKSQIRWDGANETGMKVSAGIYYARMKSSSFNGTIQMQRSAQ